MNRNMSWLGFPINKSHMSRHVRCHPMVRTWFQTYIEWANSTLLSCFHDLIFFKGLLCFASLPPSLHILKPTYPQNSLKQFVSLSRFQLLFHMAPTNSLNLASTFCFFSSDSIDTKWISWQMGKIHRQDNRKISETR